MDIDTDIPIATIAFYANKINGKMQFHKLLYTMK